MSIRTCVEWAEQSYQECSQEEDQGYQECSRSEDQGYRDCCDWWPCSWACDAWTWVSNLVCVAWTWVSNVVCVVWTTIRTVVCVIWSIVEVILIPITWILTWITWIPYVGRFIDFIINIIQTIVIRFYGLAGTILDILGIRLSKKLRICIIILRDEQGNETVNRDAGGVASDLQAAIAAAQQIFSSEADIELHVEGIHTVKNSSPDYALDVGCNGAAFGENLGLTGSYFEATANIVCVLGTTSRFLGWGAQMVVFCVRDIPGNTAGCALGPFTDYLTLEGNNPLCLAHEIGHKIGLWHCCPGTNLANGICGGTQLDWWQVLIARNSKYVTYF